jgi:deoxyribonuclease IV
MRLPITLSISVTFNTTRTLTMPHFGAHLSIAGGLHKAVESALTMGMETVQIFTFSPQSWTVPAVGDKKGKKKTLDADQIATFRDALKRAKLKHSTAHDSYLINLASPDDAIRRRSIEAFVGEVERAESLGLSHLVMHPGAHMDSTVEEGLSRVAEALDETHERCPKFKVKIALEITAGQGSSLGHRFEHIGTILEAVTDAKRLCVCFDTCHAFAAGYAMGTQAEYRDTMKQFDDRIGLKRLKVFHLNDSKKPLGSRVDRHEWIGQGYLGIEPFRHIVNDDRFAELPMILETPKTNDAGEEMDPVNLAILKGLIQSK